MLIKIHGFPKKTKYQDVKVLVRSQCTITDFKLDNLGVDSHGNKNVLVTVRNEAEALCLVKCLNGYQITNECMLRVEGPEKLNVENEGHDNMYEQRSGGNYQNPPRNEYSNQSSGTYNRGPPSYASSGPLNVPTPRVMEPQPARPEVWNSSNVSGNQWSNSPSNLQGPPNTTFPGTPIYPQHPSIPQRMDNNSYNENRPQQSSNYGYPPKNTAPDSGHQHYRSNDLRYMEVADGVPSQVLTHPGRHQQSFQQEKPITIMKDNFQGPTMYQIGSGNSGPYQGTTPQSGNPAWNQGQQSKHQAYAKLSPMQFDKYDDDRRHPQMDKRVDVVKSAQEGGRVSYKDYEKGRQYSPPRRIDHAMSGEVKKRISPPGHGAPLNREVMSRRLVSPERKISPMGIPTHRNISPPPRRPSPPSRWIPVTRPVQSPSERRVSPPGRRVSPPIRRESSPGRRFSPPGRRVSPRKRAMSPDAHVSPLGRRVSPSGRRLPERHPSPQAGRRMSPPHKRVSPTGRRVPSTERRLSPNGRHMVERRVSPRRLAMKRSSPSRRLESPPHTSTRPPQRYSPRRHHEKMADPKMDMDALKGKQVRPAYESQASSQAMYSGGYRPNPKETIPYGMSGARQPDQNVSSWQQERDKDAYTSMKKQPEERRDVMEKRHPMRQSRSPLHRDRSPVTDRFRTNSPVSHSPRRSWALEKRPYGRSPEIREAPPPPIWPGKISRDSDPYKNKYNRVEDAPKQPPVWDRPAMPMEDKKRLDDVRRSGEDKRVGGAPPRMDPAGTYSQTQTDSKFTPREYVDTRKDEYHQRPREVGRRPSPVDIRKDVYERQRDVARRPSPERREFREGRPPHQQEERRHHDYRRQPSPRRDEPKKTEFEKDFEDIYKRTQEFKKKAEQMRRFDDRRRDTHSEERHRDVPKEDKYDRRRERSPQLRGDMDRHMRAEHERRRYEDVKHKEREPEWKLQDSISRKPILSPETKMKREKAADEILVKIINKRKEIAELREEQRRYVAEELRSVLQRMFMDMFGDQDVSFIEIVIRYQTKISDKAEEAMLRDILQNMPASYRATKRVGPEPEVPAKMARYSPETAMKEDYTDNNQTDSYVPDWTLNVIEPTQEEERPEPPRRVNLPPPQLVAPQLAAPVLVPPVGPNFAPPQQFLAPQFGIPQVVMPVAAPIPSITQYIPTFAGNKAFGESSGTSSSQNKNKLILGRSDYKPITSVEAEFLKNFIVANIIKITENSEGWSPDVILKGLDAMDRYELQAKDEASKNWLVNLDFSDFTPFNVVVYADEMWYERAAIWLPGHSRYNRKEPWDKLKLQNKNLKDVNIDKWKFVKKIVTMKGTRLYVDMPSSSVGALEKNKMMLSYELQKVNVIRKAVAVDKKSFDDGLEETSVDDVIMLATAINNTPVPWLNHEPDLVQLMIKGSKKIFIEEARNIKEVVLFHLYKYLEEGGTSKTDFLKYGIYPPYSFGIVPENAESKRWLLSTQFSKPGQHPPIVVVGGDESCVKYITMYMNLPAVCKTNAIGAIERLSRSNKGIKGINFNLWKPLTPRALLNPRRPILTVDMDLESVETLEKLDFRMDYVDNENNVKSVHVRHKTLSLEELSKLLEKYKTETRDSYDVSNMDLATSDDDAP